VASQARQLTSSSPKSINDRLLTAESASCLYDTLTAPKHCKLLAHRKSTLLLQVAAMLGPDVDAGEEEGSEEETPAPGQTVLYVSAEESVEQVTSTFCCHL
jgi:hypothetical protein